MAAQALYRKWRSQTFDTVVGQEHVTLTLRNALRDGRMSHAYLFTGPRGTGKTSTARILAKAINCLAEDSAVRPCNQCHICTAITEGRLLDLIEIDAASNRGIDEIRDLREKIGFRPNEARYKVYIIDEVHMLTKEAFNALLKTLEEPPPHAVFVLATTEPDRVPETVRSRCQRFDFRRVPTSRIVEHLSEVLHAEGAQATPEALLAIARRSTGSMRDAISLLDQLLSYGDDIVDSRRVESVLGLVDAQTIGRLVASMVAHDAAAGLRLINQLVANGVELGELVDQVLAYLRALLFMQVVRSPDALDVSEDMIEMLAQQAEAATPDFVLAALREFSEARAALRDQVPGVPQLPVEIAFMRAALPASGQAAAPTGAVQPARSVEVSLSRTVQTREVTPQAGGQAAPVARQASAQPTEQFADRPAEGAEGASSTSEPSGDTSLLAAIQQNWEQFVTLAGKRCGVQVGAALRSARSYDVIGGTLVLQFAHDLVREKVGEGENRLKVENLLQEMLSRRVPVRCVLLNEKSASTGQGMAQQMAARAESDDDVLLRDAQNLGAVVKRLDRRP